MPNESNVRVARIELSRGDLENGFIRVAQVLSKTLRDERVVETGWSLHGCPNVRGSMPHSIVATTNRRDTSQSGES